MIKFVQAETSTAETTVLQALEGLIRLPRGVRRRVLLDLHDGVVLHRLQATSPSDAREALLIETWEYQCLSRHIVPCP